MSRVLVTRRAQSDLLECWINIAKDNVKAADRFWGEVKEKFKILARAPNIGRLRKDYGLGLRSLPIGNYVIFYRIVGNKIQIIRFLHGARDLPRLFSEG